MFFKRKKILGHNLASVFWVSVVMLSAGAAICWYLFSKPRVPELIPPRTLSSIVDSETGLRWTKTDNGEHASWESANRYCEKLQLDGVRNWRLPTIGELRTLYDPERYPEANWPGGIKEPFELTHPWIWSSEKIDSSIKGFKFNVGKSYPVDLSAQGRALCVSK
jgi:hypothetical protein